MGLRPFGRVFGTVTPRQKALRKAKNGRATGPCGSAVAELKQLPDAAIIHLLSFLKLHSKLAFLISSFLAG